VVEPKKDQEVLDLVTRDRLRELLDAPVCLLFPSFNIEARLTS
jgi:hypothetical protein